MLVETKWDLSDHGDAVIVTFAADEAGWGSNKSDHTENYSRSEAYSWGQKVVSGNEAALGANKTENETEKGREQALGIKRWSVGMRLREVQTRWKMKPRRVWDQVLEVKRL
ncbi:hypothetical protein Tco_1254811 [Tanacetum coccineum]